MPILRQKVKNLIVERLFFEGKTEEIVPSVLLGTGESVDLNGEAAGIILDADADTSISAPTDDQIDVEIAGADDFRFTANTFTALNGSTIATNAIAETTAASGVTIDGTLVKDGGVDATGTVATDTIAEHTSAAGVTIDGALLKDGRSNLGRQVQALTASGAISIKSGLVTLAHATVAIAATLVAPVAGDELLIVDASASGTAAHTVKLGSGVTFDGTNNTATLDAPNEALHIIAVSATRWYIVDNNGSVGLSST